MAVTWSFRNPRSFFLHLGTEASESGGVFLRRKTRSAQKQERSSRRELSMPTCRDTSAPSPPSPGRGELGWLGPRGSARPQPGAQAALNCPTRATWAPAKNWLARSPTAWRERAEGPRTAPALFHPTPSLEAEPRESASCTPRSVARGLCGGAQDPCPGPLQSRGKAKAWTLDHSARGSGEDGRRPERDLERGWRSRKEHLRT